MNILEHIKAGHYPKNDKGQPIIQRRGPGISQVYVLSTDGPSGAPIVVRTEVGASVQIYSLDGRYSGNTISGERVYSRNSPELALLPPEKVEKSLGFAVFNNARDEFFPNHIYPTREKAEVWLDAGADEVVTEVKGVGYQTY